MHCPLTNGTRLGGTVDCGPWTEGLSVTPLLLVKPGTGKMPKNCYKQKDTPFNVTNVEKKINIVELKVQYKFDSKSNETECLFNFPFLTKSYKLFMYGRNLCRIFKSLTCIALVQNFLERRPYNLSSEVSKIMLRNGSTLHLFNKM